jgi:3-(3-hydroxy-phenyl)propionate hydroxylase
VLSLSLTQDFVRPLYHWRTSRPHEYTRSALNSPGDDDARFTAGPATARRRRTCGWAPTTSCSTTSAPASPAGVHPPLLPANRVQDVVQAARQRGVPLQVLAIGATAQPVAGADAHLPDADGRVRQRYGVPADGAAYLLRPDQHVCARWLALDADRLQAALATALPADKETPDVHTPWPARPGGRVRRAGHRHRPGRP